MFRAFRVPLKGIWRWCLGCWALGSSIYRVVPFKGVDERIHVYIYIYIYIYVYIYIYIYNPKPYASDWDT